MSRASVAPEPVAGGQAVAVALVLAFLLSACGSDDSVPSPRPPARDQGAESSKSGTIVARPGKPRNLATVRKAHRKHGDELFDAFDGVVGHGVGAAEEGSSAEPDEHAFVITVYLEDSGGLPDEPYSLTGIPLRFEVTGPFEAYEAQ